MRRNSLGGDKRGRPEHTKPLSPMVQAAQGSGRHEGAAGSRNPSCGLLGTFYLVMFHNGALSGQVLRAPFYKYGQV